MAAENSYHCKDYVTEKVYRNAFEMESVPLVSNARKSDYLVPPISAVFVKEVDLVFKLLPGTTPPTWRKLDFTEQPTPPVLIDAGINVDYMWYAGDQHIRLNQISTFTFYIKNI